MMTLKNPNTASGRSVQAFLTKHIILLVFGFCQIYFCVDAQVIPWTSTPLNYYSNCLATGVTNCTTTGVNPSGTLSPGSQDYNWCVSSSAIWSGSPAIVINPPGGCFYGGNGSGAFPVAWITSGSYNCGGSLGNYSCTSVPLDLYYTITFTLPANPVFMLDWVVRSDGWVQSITVNSTVAYTSTATNFTAYVDPFSMNTGFNFRWCWFQPGLNTVKVRVKNNGMAPGNQPRSDDCKRTGLWIMNKIAVYNTQQYNNAYTFTTITGTSQVCPGTKQLFSIPNKSVLPVPNPPASYYQWILPPAWIGPASSTNSQLATVQTSSVIGVNIFSTSATGKYCLSTNLFSVTVPPPLTVTPSAASVCKGESSVLTASGATTYTWLAPGLVTISNGTSAVVSPTLVTTYTVKGTTALGCVYNKSVTVTVKPTPAVSVASSATQICSGFSTMISGSTTASPPTFTWQNSTSAATTVSPSLIVSPSVTTTYSASSSFTNLCTGRATIQIVVNPTPTVNLTGSPLSICPGQSSTLSASSSGTISSWSWTPAVSSTNTAVVSPTTSTIYTAVASTSKSCSGRGSVLVTVLQQPTLQASPGVICPNISNTLTAFVATTYTWYAGSTTTTPISNASFVVVSPTAPTVYWVCGTNPGTNSCVACASTALNYGSTVNLSAPDVVQCTNGGPCTTLSASSTYTGPVSYYWTGPSSYSALGASPAVCSLTTGTYFYTVEASAPLTCPNTALVKLDVYSNCCAQSTTNLSTLPDNLNGSYGGTSYVLDRPVLVDQNTLFQDMEIWMTPDAKITVTNGAELELDHAHLYACGINMWAGIEVQDQSRIVTNPINTRGANSMIEDALIAIDLSNISLTNTFPNPPIDIQRVLFNRNYIGINIANSDPKLDSLALGITGCVFTSREFTFTTAPTWPLDWPSTEMNAFLGGLRVNSSPTTGLAPPFTFTCGTPGIPVFAPANLKQPYNSQPGHIGIKIQNIGDPNGYLPTPGVQFGVTYTGVRTNDFNLFDGLGEGIDVTDASLTTIGNVFQNSKYYMTTNAVTSQTAMFGGQGVRHEITGNNLMNARLSLKSDGTKLGGNDFWECNTGILASNVYQCWVRDAVFRSNSHSAANYGTGGPMPGDTGISYSSNRFEFSTHHSEFNNLTNGIVFQTPVNTYSFDMDGSGPQPGVSVTGIYVEHNYFGPEVTSTTPYSSPGSANTTEYMSNAMQFITPNFTFPYYLPSRGMALNWIISNKINRAFRGLLIEGMGDIPLAISHNSVFVEDDWTTTPPLMAFGYGVAAQNNYNNLAISTNTLEARDSQISKSVSLVYCANNSGGPNAYGPIPFFQSPSVTCNMVRNANSGFQFDGFNGTTKWEGNYICTCRIGLFMTNAAVIGPQGDPNNASANVWDDGGAPTYSCSPWNTGPAQYQILCDNNTDANMSPLYVFNISGCIPTVNIATGGSTVYAPGVNIFQSPTVAALSDCYLTTTGYYGPPPAWRLSGHESGLNAEADILAIEGLRVFPNPTNGNLNVESPDQEAELRVTLYDVSGKLVYTDTLKGTNKYLLNISDLPPAIYIVEIKSNKNKTMRRKLVKTG